MLKEFLKTTLPSEGYLCVVAHTDQGMRHTFHESQGSAAALIRKFEAEDHATVYFALASFRDKKRLQKNVQAVRSLWLDVDCGDGKPYPDQKAGLLALKEFLAASKLPAPQIVSSGYGLHLYWPFETDVTLDVWQPLAAKLRTLTEMLGFHVDQSRTTDSASILRPIGTTNHKHGREVPVRLLRHGGPFKVEDIAAVLKPVPVAADAAAANAAFSVPMPDGLPPGDPETLANNCRQFDLLRETRGNVEEPLWYAQLGALNFCEDGARYAKEWSAGHKDYSESATLDKMEQWKARTSGPPTCAYFDAKNPGVCQHCPHWNRITTPLQVAVKIEEAPQPDELADILPPRGFKRDGNAIYKDVEGELTKVIDGDMYPLDIYFDQALGYACVSLRYKHPLGHWQTFQFRLSAVNQPRDLAQAITDHGILLESNQSVNLLRAYIVGYLKQLQQVRKTIDLTTTMGWKSDDTEFVLGPKIIQPSGIEQAGMSSTVSKDVLDSFNDKGKAEHWSAATKVLGKPGAEAHALALLFGFGAPLLKFTGIEALLVNLLGPTGTGKSTAQKWVNSIYGDPRRLRLLARDTPKSLFHRIGLYNNLPATIDEMEVMDVKALRPFVLSLTSGRDMARLRQDTSERTPEQWNTIIIGSSNRSIGEILVAQSMNNDAQQMRILELPVDENDLFNGNAALGTKLNRLLDCTYGVVGVRYIEELVKQRDTLAERLEAKAAGLQPIFEFEPEERFWAAGIRAALVGGEIAREAGLIQYDFNEAILWLRERVKETRVSRIENQVNDVELLSIYLTAHLDNTLTLKGPDSDGRMLVLGDVPRNRIFVRVEAGRSALYIAQTHLRKWITTIGRDYKAVRRALISIGLVTETSVPIYLTKNTPKHAPTVRCWKVDLSHPTMKGYTKEVYERADNQRREKVTALNGRA